MRKIDLNDSELTQLLQQSWLRIHSLLALTENQCYRLIHDLKNEFQVDVYGTTIWVYWYKENLISESETSVFLTFSKAKNKNLVIRHMTNRGAGVGGLENKDFIKSDHQPEQWTTEENKILLNKLIKREDEFMNGSNKSDMLFGIYQKILQ